VTVLLANDAVALYLPGELDAHGWRVPPDDATSSRPVWSGVGNLQLYQGTSDPRAESGGGRGPHDPNRVAAGNLFLPPGADPLDGMTAVVRGQVWVLSLVRFITDPTDLAGFLSCWSCAVTAAPRG
jgi:hypothetical protein